MPMCARGVCLSWGKGLGKAFDITRHMEASGGDGQAVTDKATVDGVELPVGQGEACIGVARVGLLVNEGEAHGGAAEVVLLVDEGEACGGAAEVALLVNGNGGRRAEVLLRWDCQLTRGRHA